MKISALLCVLGAALFNPGCVTTKYQKAPARTPPAVPLHLPGSPTLPLRTEVETVIVYNGPGSWKRRAYWDEYIISVSNPGTTPVSLLSAHLVSDDGESAAAGEDWEALERQSVDWWKRNATPENFLLGAGMTLLGASAGVSVLFLGAAGLAGAAPLFGLALGGLVVSAATGMLLDRPSDDGRKVITAEFTDRQLDLPLTVAPGDTLRGSVFFRVTPSPQKLTLRCQTGGQVKRIEVDLGVLSALHRRTTAQAQLGSPTARPQPLAQGSSIAAVAPSVAPNAAAPSSTAPSSP